MAEKIFERPPSVVVWGPQGCGKSTNAKRISEYFGLSHIYDEDPSYDRNPEYLQKKKDVLILSNKPLSIGLKTYPFDEVMRLMEGSHG